MRESSILVQPYFSMVLIEGKAENRSLSNRTMAQFDLDRSVDDESLDAVVVTRGHNTVPSLPSDLNAIYAS
jgi:hypothetical protein